MSFRRLAQGGRIDRARALTFRFDGGKVRGFAGDTLASALLAANTLVVGRSFKYHRPRGIMAAGAEEPNALLTLGKGGTEIPNLPATMIPLEEGLQAKSQNAWPSRNFDLRAVNRAFAPMLGVGFYYKTFVGPFKTSWMFYEKHIRKAAGLGQTGTQASELRHDTRHNFGDVLIVGSGAAGLAAALAAAQSGLRVTLAEQDFELGGGFLSSTDAAHGAWRDAALEKLRAAENMRLLTRATVQGIYDGNLATIAIGQNLELLRVRSIIFAGGASERPLVFEGNDTPGVMLASALATYAARFAIVPEKRCVLATNNDSAYEAAATLASLGANVAVIDQRRDIPGLLLARAAAHGVAVFPGSIIAKAHGGKQIDSVTIEGPHPETLACDALGMSGGWSPLVHLTSHTGAKPQWNDALQALVPGALPEGHFAAGSCAGVFGVKAAIADGEAKAQAAVQLLRKKPVEFVAAESDSLMADLPFSPVPAALPCNSAAAFVDFQGDVTAKDVAQALDEGYSNPEHLKRYTTLGMGTDQGKTSNVNALALIHATTPTTFRPPFTPLLVGQIAGRHVGAHFRPTRLSPLHDWNMANGATFLDAGLWKRAWYFAWAGDTVESASKKEMELVRRDVGLADISTLGKIGVSGRDALEFLDRVYVNGMKTLPVGKARYGVMLNDDGLVLDDGTVARFGAQDFYVTTTTAMAAEVMTWLEKLAQMHWPDLDVRFVSLTDQYGGMALSGPKARAALELAFPKGDFSDAKLPHMGVREFDYEGVTIRLMRMSFSGELAYEIHCPADYVEGLWRHVLAAGEPLGLKPYGLEALASLRVEKGHIAGPELDRRVSLDDLSLGRMASKKKAFVGDVLRQRGDLATGKRPQLVGFELMDKEKKMRAGAILFAASDPLKGHGRGHISSVTWSTDLQMEIGLGFFEGGLAHENEEVIAAFPLRNEYVRLRVVNPQFIDRGGTRLHA